MHDPSLSSPVAHVSDEPRMMRRREMDRERRVYLARRVISMHPPGSLGIRAFITSLTERHGAKAAAIIIDDIARESVIFHYKPTETDQRQQRQSDRYAGKFEDKRDEFVVDPEINRQGISNLNSMLNQAVASIRKRQEVKPVSGMPIDSRPSTHASKKEGAAKESPSPESMMFKINPVLSTGIRPKQLSTTPPAVEITPRNDQVKSMALPEPLIGNDGPALNHGLFFDSEY